MEKKNKATDKIPKIQKAQKKLKLPKTNKKVYLNTSLNSFYSCG